MTGSQQSRAALVLFLLAAPACAAAPAPFSEPEAAAVAGVLEEYRQAWLANDAERVMAHVSDSVEMYVPGSGSSTLRGKPALRAFWFPPSDTLYVIRRYEISNQKVYGSGTLAFVQGTSSLGWDTVVGDSTLSSANSRTEFITTLRKEAGAWRIFRQMYVMRN